MGLIKKLKSFTLIELMIVAAVIGIIAVIAIPDYLNYVKRTQISEVLTLFNEIKYDAILAMAYDGVVKTDEPFRNKLINKLESSDIINKGVAKIYQKNFGCIHEQSGGFRIQSQLGSTCSTGFAFLLNIKGISGVTAARIGSLEGSDDFMMVIGFINDGKSNKTVCGYFGVKYDRSKTESFIPNVCRNIISPMGGHLNL